MKAYGSVAVGGIGGGAPDLTIRPYDPTRYADTLRLNATALAKERQARQAYIDASQGKGTSPKPRAPRQRADFATAPVQAGIRTNTPTITQEMAEEWKARIEAGETFAAVAESAGRAKSTIRTYVRRLGAREPLPRPHKDRDDAHLIVADYLAGDRAEVVAQRRKCSRATVYRLVREAGHEVRSTGSAHPPHPVKWSDDDVAAWAADRRAGLTFTQIAVKHGAPQPTVIRRLKGLV